MQTKFMKNYNLIAISGLSIIFIILHHIIALHGQLIGMSLMFSSGILATIGVYGFTFVAGYKLFLNHSGDFDNRHFYKQYMPKRVMRLIKPYITYTLILFVPFFLFKDKFALAPTLSMSEVLVELLKGNNIIAPPLWYLYMLCVITLIIMITLYINRYLLLIAIIPMWALSFQWIDFYIVFCIGMIAASARILEFDLTYPNLIILVGINSFWLYLFHYPIFSVIDRLLVSLNPLIAIVSTFIITISGCFLAYELMKKLNILWLFE